MTPARLTAILEAMGNAPDPIHVTFNPTKVVWVDFTDEAFTAPTTPTVTFGFGPVTRQSAVVSEQGVYFKLTQGSCMIPFDAILMITAKYIHFDKPEVKANPWACPDIINRPDCIFSNPAGLTALCASRELHSRPTRITKCVRVKDRATFIANVFGGECIVDNFPDIMTTGMTVQLTNHYGKKVWHILIDGKRAHDTSFLTCAEMDYVEEIANA